MDFFTYLCPYPLTVFSVTPRHAGVIYNESLIVENKSNFTLILYECVCDMCVCALLELLLQAHVILFPR